MVQGRKEESATSITKDEELNTEKNEKDVSHEIESEDEIITDDGKNDEKKFDQEHAENNNRNEDIANNELIEELQKQNIQLNKEKEDLYNRMLRIQAEFDNYKKRTQRERTAERKYKSQDLANELLPALDNFERALSVEITDETKSILEGISMVYRQIQEALKAEGIEVIESVGKEFDPNLHHAVMQVEDESKETNIIVEELQKGYMLKDRVIRPAMVKVNK